MGKQGIGYTAIFMFLATFLFTGALSWVHTSTAERVANNDRESYQRTVLAAIGVEPDTQEEVFERYRELNTSERDGILFYETEVDGEQIVAKQFAGPGVWGEISGIMSFTADGSRIRGVEIIDQNETPGLGARVTEEWFLEQLSGELIVDGQIRINRGDGDYDKENGTIDGITGATGTSRSFHRMINDSIQVFYEVTDAGN
jgi:Na+-transporting NADH:ubiquinone oxidoreductase subunit C